MKEINSLNLALFSNEIHVEVHLANDATAFTILDNLVFFWYRKSDSKTNFIYESF